MKYVPSILFVVLVVTCLVLGKTNSVPTPVPQSLLQDASPNRGEDVPHLVLPPQGDSSVSLRTALVPQRSSTVPADGERAPEVSDCLTLRAERDQLIEEVARLQLQLEKTRYPEESAYGLFLDSFEAKGTSQLERDFVRYALEEIPVLALHSGEASWILERNRQNDWKLYAETRDIALINFLGPQRVLAEATPATLDQYKEWYDKQEWLSVFGTRKPQ